MGLVGLVVAAALLLLLPQKSLIFSAHKALDVEGRDGRGFGLLMVIGSCDTATRMGYLLFLPFLIGALTRSTCRTDGCPQASAAAMTRSIHAKGGTGAIVGIGLALLFAGGALGKACCGWLGERFGVVWSVIVTEAATAIFMVATLMLPLNPTLALLPFLGIVLNGTSSVLYGTVPELARLPVP